MIRDPTAVGDMWSGPGKEILYTAEVEEGTNWEDGRSWKDCGTQCDNAESDGFTVMSRILNKAAEIGGGGEGLSVGGRVEKGEIPEVKLQ